MSGVEFLNLDDVVEATRTIQIKGQKYEVAELGVGEVLKMVAQARSNEGKSKDQAGEEEVAATLDMIQKRLPDCPREVLDGLNWAQLMELLKWLNQTAQQNVEEIQKAEGGADAGN